MQLLYYKRTTRLKQSPFHLKMREHSCILDTLLSVSHSPIQQRSTVSLNKSVRLLTVKLFVIILFSY